MRHLRRGQAQVRELRRGAQGALLEIEAEERRRSGIATLKIRFNRVFGYSLEVGAAHRDRVPADWIRRQSLANAERFATPALKELEEKILGAEDRIGEIESRLYGELLAGLAKGADRVARAASAISIGPDEKRCPYERSPTIRVAFSIAMTATMTRMLMTTARFV